MTKSVYIAGPMSGIPDWNYPAFTKAAEMLRAKGYKVYSPAEKDMQTFHDPEAQKTGDSALSIKNGKFNPREAYMWDMDKVINGDAIYMLKGWQYSPGANGEHAVAVFMKRHIPEYEIMYQSDEGMGG